MVDQHFSNGAPTVPPGGISIIMGTGGVPHEQQQWVVNQDPKKIQGNRIQIADNMTTVDRVILCASETVATAILVFLGCGGCIDFSANHTSPPPHLQVCLTFGLAVMVAVQCFGHVSGSHINPLVTVAAATLGNIPLIQVPIYFVGQLLGALGGFGLLKLATPAQFLEPSLKVCSPILTNGVTPIQGLFIEFFISFLLALTCCGVWDARNNTKHDSVPIRFGLAIAVLALTAGPYTGANMNPVRSFAPALYNGTWDNHWLYWVGPLGGGFLGALFYKFLFAKEVVDDEGTTAEVIPLNDKP